MITVTIIIEMTCNRTHMNEEKLHLSLCDPAAKALAGPKAETQAPEVMALVPQPARG